MNEEEVENRIDEIRDELLAYKKQLGSLEEDLKCGRTLFRCRAGQ
jgi:hypothetical protein